MARRGKKNKTKSKKHAGAGRTRAPAPAASRSTHWTQAAANVVGSKNAAALSAPPKPAALSAAPAAIPVWDAAVRLFHWSLVAGVCLAWASGGSGGRIHEITGYTVAGLVAFRLAWGFAGTRHARFSDFVRSPPAILAYLRAMTRGKAPRTLGHNPAGGAMILLLLSLVAILSATGWLMLTPQFFGVPWVEDLHTMAANALLVAVPLHIAGVIASSVMHRENLVLAMITGRKPVSAAEARLAQSRDQHRHPAHLVQQGIAMLLLLALIGAGYGWVTTARRVAILSSTEVQGQLTGDTKAAADEIERGRAPNTLPR